MWSDLVGGHDPQLADGGVAGAGDHVGDAVGDLLGGEDLGLLVEGVDHLVADLGRVVRAQLGRHATGFEDTDAQVPLGEFLTQGLDEAVHADLGEVVHAVAVPGDAAGDRADVDDVGDPARALFGGLQQVREGGAGGGEQALDVDGDHAVPLLGVGTDDGPSSIRPALVTRVSNRPNRATVCWTAASAWVRSVMSASTTSAVPPAWSISAARASRRSRRRATSATEAPCSASRWAGAAPIPLLAPVTRAAVPVSFAVMGCSPLLWMYGVGLAAGASPQVLHASQRRQAVAQASSWARLLDSSR